MLLAPVPEVGEHLRPLLGVGELRPGRPEDADLERILGPGVARAAVPLQIGTEVVHEGGVADLDAHWGRQPEYRASSRIR